VTEAEKKTRENRGVNLMEIVVKGANDPDEEGK